MTFTEGTWIDWQAWKAEVEAEASDEREDPAPLAACEHCGDAGRVSVGGREVDCPGCSQ